MTSATIRALRRKRAEDTAVHRLKTMLEAKYAAMGPSDIINELLAHEGAEGFSHGLADRASYWAERLKGYEK